MKKEKVQISINLPAHAKFLSGIRAFTLDFIQNMTNLDRKWAHRFQAIVDELCTNAIEYGSASKENMTLTLIYTPQKKFEVIVEDGGTGKSHKKAAELQKILSEKTGPESVRGRGLSQIVKSWTDEIHFSDRTEGGIKVHVIKKF